MKRRVLVITLWLVGLFALFCHYYPLFPLNEVSVDGTVGTADVAVAGLLNANTGDNVLRLDLSGWSERIAALPAYSGARTYVTLGGRAVAKVAKEEPVCFVDTDPVAGLTAMGVLLPLSQHPVRERVPLITGIGGEPIYYARLEDGRVLAALAFYRRWRARMGDVAERLTEIHVTPELEIGIYLWPDRRFVTIGRGEWTRKLEQLSLLLERLPPATRPLDVRFAGQVIETP